MLVFLFTDMENSTRLWEKHQNEMGRALAQHDAIIRSAVQTFGGEVVKSTGDGFFAVFEGGSPIECAFEMQRALAQSEWGPIGAVRVRVGLYAGEAEKRDGDYFGTAVNRAARLVSVAWGGQTLLSTEVLAAAPLPQGASLQDLGTHLLRDLNEPLQVYGLSHPALPQQEFPPLRSLSTYPHNLPAQLTPFLGRQAELAEIAQQLQTPGCRLVTLMGPGGIGKTRLAIQAAAEQVEAFSYGVYFVPLAVLSEPNLILPAIADTIGLALHGREEAKAQLLTFLRDKSLLLVLDNFEHLIAGSNVITELLEQAPDLKILVTSRVRLNLRGEWLLEVNGLRVPSTDLTDPAHEWSVVELFVQSARSVQPRFRPGAADWPAIVRICRLVEGIPLAIELAATWIRVLSCREIAQEIEANLDFLTASARDVPERHRSLRTVFDYSWQLLSPAEQRLVRKLAVFRGGFRREAAVQVAQASLALLSALADKSLLFRNASGRYEMHEVWRHYLSQKLADAPQDSARVQEAHASYYLEFLQGQAVGLLGEKQKEALAEIGAELENVRAAWRWATEQHCYAALSATLDSLYHFYELRGWVEEGEVTLARLVAAMRADARSGTLSPADHRRLLGRALAHRGRLVATMGHCPEARDLLQAALAAFVHLDPCAEVAFALYSLGDLARTLGDYQQAEQLLLQALAIFRDRGDQHGIARTLNALGILAKSQGNYPRAWQLYEESLALYSALGQPTGIARALNNLGVVAEAQGDYQAAQQFYYETHLICSESGDQWGTGIALNNLGHALQTLGDETAAHHYLQAALQHLMAVRAIPVILDTIVGIATLLSKAGRKEAALELLAFTRQHAAILDETRHCADALWETLRAEVHPQTLISLQARGKARDIETVVASLRSNEGGFIAQRELDKKGSGSYGCFPDGQPRMGRERGQEAGAPPPTRR
jgi:predicted ATPase/class 3 adenylate cyclase